MYELSCNACYASDERSEESDMSNLLCAEHKKECQTVVRVVTTSWHDGKGLHTKRSLNLLKRKSFGFEILKEECDNIGADDAARNITNLHEVPDGVYELVAVNVSRDVETGYVDDWDLKLIPFDPDFATKRI